MINYRLNVVTQTYLTVAYFDLGTVRVNSVERYKEGTHEISV
ncbi:hypothetical protein XIS1_1660002 [Xenorhabdus innexi]|uniref:Uncharacterized protein n=1 Tax=Xenorhabdus innexi TaxID=290109 RepID=A0A1N6MV49_9GAMM|nr:hypothetical protein XIS1_1660002 [Xenorhabdus innexi]